MDTQVVAQEGATQEEAPLLELQNVSKHFGDTQALSDVSLKIYPGKVHALIGENGAGKSTIIKIMTGIHQPDVGEVVLNGQEIKINSTLEAQQAGIAAIYQEPLVFPDLDVAENIFINHFDRGMLMRWGKMYTEAKQLVNELGVNLDVRDQASTLTLAEQQAIEIVRSLSLNVKLLIMDEPTASLSAHEATRLLEIVNNLRSKGVAIVYISHRIEEVMEIADTITVLRDGSAISTRPINECSVEEIVKEMVGRELEEVMHEHTEHDFGDTLLKVENLKLSDTFEDINFEVRSGEILCFAGLVGARRTDVGLALFGIAPAEQGTITLEGKNY